MSHHINYTAAALMAAGGLAGFAKKRSLPSLAAGLTFGATYAFAGYLVSHGTEQGGHDLAVVASVVAGSVMGARAWRSKKFMPAGAVASLALIAGLYNAKKAYEWRFGV